MHPIQTDPLLPHTVQPAKRTNIGLLTDVEKDILRAEHEAGDYKLAKGILSHIGELCSSCGNDNSIISYRIQLAYSDNDL